MYVVGGARRSGPQLVDVVFHKAHEVRIHEHEVDGARRSGPRLVDMVHHQAHEVRIHAHELAHYAHELALHAHKLAALPRQMSIRARLLPKRVHWLATIWSDREGSEFALTLSVVRRQRTTWTAPLLAAYR